MGAGRTAVVAHPEAPVGPDAARRYQADIERRATGEPVAYIRGLKEFYGLAFSVDPRALIPRPETERLVELAEAEVMRRLGLASPAAGPLRIVDVGTGSGAIAVALAASLRRRGAAEAIEMLATDVSADALDLARENAVSHAVADRVTFERADLLPDRAGLVRSRAGQPAVCSPRRDGRRFRRRPRSSPSWPSTGASTASRSSAGWWTSCRPRWQPTGSRCSRSAPTRARRS